MGLHYRINYRQYDDMLCKEYQTNNLICAIYKLIALRFKYELVDFSYRK